MSQTITVEGMTCGGCEQNVEEALTDVSGVESASVDRNANSASVEGDADTATLVQAVEDAGYNAHA